jgi:hypothetical protein
MTAAGVHQSRPGAAPALAASRGQGLPRLAYMYQVSRRVPGALTLLAGFGVLLWAALFWHWNIAGGAAAAMVIPLIVEAGVAAVIAVTTYGPFGEPERATGRWLPYLRLGTAVALTAAAVGALAAGSTGGALPEGFLAMLRNVAGVTGVGLVSAAVFGGMLAWAGPMAYLVLTETMLAGGRSSPWVWPTKPPHDLDAALCAAGVFVAGALLIMLRGARDTASRD